MKDHQLLRIFIRESHKHTNLEFSDFKNIEKNFSLREINLPGVNPGSGIETMSRAASKISDELISKANAPDICDKTYENNTDIAWAVLIASFLILGHPQSRAAVSQVASTLSRRITPHLSSVLANTSRLSTIGLLTDFLSVFFTGIFLKHANQALNQYFDIVTLKGSSQDDIKAAHALLLTRLFLLYFSYKIAMVSSSPSVAISDGMTFVGRVHSILVNMAKEPTLWMKSYMVNFTTGIASMAMLENEEDIAEIILKSSLFEKEIRGFHEKTRSQKIQLAQEKARVDYLNATITAMESLKISLGEGQFSKDEMKLLSDHIKNETFKDIEGYSFNQSIFSDPREMSVTSAMCAMRALIERYYEDYIDKKSRLGDEIS